MLPQWLLVHVVDLCATLIRPFVALKCPLGAVLWQCWTDVSNFNFHLFSWCLDSVMSGLGHYEPSCRFEYKHIAINVTIIVILSWCRHPLFLINIFFCQEWSVALAPPFLMMYYTVLLTMDMVIILLLILYCLCRARKVAVMNDHCVGTVICQRISKFFALFFVCMGHSIF